MNQANQLRKAAAKFLNHINVTFQIDDLGKEIHLQPSTKGRRIFEGMQLIMDKETGTCEVSEYQAGPTANDLHIYGVYKTPSAAMRSLLKGNGYGTRNPIKVY